MFRLLTIAALALAFASSAFAQSSQQSSQSSDYNKIEFYGGYSHVRVDVGDGGLPVFSGQHEGFNGFNTAVTGNITRYIGLKFDLAGHFKHKTFPVGPPATIDVDSNLFTFLGGVQLKDNSKERKFKPFAQALVGVARGRNRLDFNNVICAAVLPSLCTDITETDTGFGGAFGGGLDIRVNNRFDIRAVQVDYNPTNLFGETQHNVRIGAGIVIH